VGAVAGRVPVAGPDGGRADAAGADARGVRRLVRRLPAGSGAAEPATLFAPASVSDRSDGKIAHLDGLNLSRAWCWRGIASALDDDRKAIALKAADDHLAVALPQVTGDYMGEHWLASFALLALLAAAAT
jgi:hypothetical protein